MSDTKDPFGERAGRILRRRLHLLGGLFEFQSDSARLLRLMDSAYANLPRHRLSRSVPRFQVRLQLAAGDSFGRSSEPPPLRTQAGAGFLCGIIDPASFAVVCPRTGEGLVSFSRELLRFPYHARYELLEFAVFTLASRAQGLAPLHAGCVGSKDRGVLLIGDSGAGKSTLALHCLLQGMDFLAEDSVFVAPDSLHATGVANFLHLREDALRFIAKPAVAAHVRRSPVIRRRSGVSKFEIDVRRKGYRLARAPLEIVGVVFLSAKPAKGAAVLTPLSHSKALSQLKASQPYAAGLPSWKSFERNLARVGAFDLRRGRHPAEAATAVRRLIEWGRRSK